MQSPMDPMDLAHHANMTPSRDTHRDIRNDNLSVVPASLSSGSGEVMDPQRMMQMMAMMCQHVMGERRSEEPVLLQMQPRTKAPMGIQQGRSAMSVDSEVVRRSPTISFLIHVGIVRRCECGEFADACACDSRVGGIRC